MDKATENTAQAERKQSIFLGLPEFERALREAGWRIQAAPTQLERGSQCNWYAWSDDRAEFQPDCASNEKPPSFVVNPFSMCLDGRVIESVEVEVCGEAPGGTWLKLQAYSIDVAEFFERIPLIRAQLAAAWNAAASMQVPPVAEEK